MPESPEHFYLKKTFLNTLDTFSKLKLYGFQETERKKFDFSCLLARDWERPLVGQTLWQHREGIDKDIRTLLTEPDSEIKAYIASDSIQNRVTIREVIEDFRRSEKHREDLFRLKLFWVPPDFDADNEKQRRVVDEILKAGIVADILFNVVFGNLTEDDLRLFLDVSGIAGLNLAILYDIAVNGWDGMSRIKERLNVSASPIREKLITLTACGFLWRLPQAHLYWVSPKGRVFLDLVSRIACEMENEALSSELEYLLRGLGCEVLPYGTVEEQMWDSFTTNAYVALVGIIGAAAETFDVEFEDVDYCRVTYDKRTADEMLRRRSGILPPGVNPTHEPGET